VRAEDRGHGAESRGQRAGSRGHGAESEEQGAKRRKKQETKKI